MKGKTDRIRGHRRLRQGHPGKAPVQDPGGPGPGLSGDRLSRYGNPFAQPVDLYLHGALGNHPGRRERLRRVGDVRGGPLRLLQGGLGRLLRGGRHRGGQPVHHPPTPVHQASKLPEGQRREFLDWLFDLEYGRMGLPEPDLVLYLDMPTEVTEKMLRRREEATATAADIHEQDGDYLRRCRESARRIAGGSEVVRHRLRPGRHAPDGGGHPPGGPRPGGAAAGIAAPMGGTRKWGARPHLRAASAAAAAAAVTAAPAAAVPAADGAAAAAAATDQNDDEE